MHPCWRKSYRNISVILVENSHALYAFSKLCRFLWYLSSGIPEKACDLNHVFLPLNDLEIIFRGQNKKCTPLHTYHTIYSWRTYHFLTFPCQGIVPNRTDSVANPVWTRYMILVTNCYLAKIDGISLQKQNVYSHANGKVLGISP